MSPVCQQASIAGAISSPMALAAFSAAIAGALTPKMTSGFRLTNSAAVGTAVSVAVVADDVAPSAPAELVQLLPERIQPGPRFRIAIGIIGHHGGPHRPLRARRERPRN